MVSRFRLLFPRRRDAVSLGLTFLLKISATCSFKGARRYLLIEVRMYVLPDFSLRIVQMRRMTFG